RQWSSTLHYTPPRVKLVGLREISIGLEHRTSGRKPIVCSRPGNSSYFECSRSKTVEVVRTSNYRGQTPVGRALPRGLIVYIRSADQKRMVRSALPDKTRSGRSLLFIVDANLISSSLRIVKVRAAPYYSRIVASLDRKRLGQDTSGWKDADPR